MHLLSTRPGGYVEDDGMGVVRVARVQIRRQTKQNVIRESLNGMQW